MDQPIPGPSFPPLPVIDYLPIGVIITEAPSGRCLFVNRRMRELWGHPIPKQESLAGQDFHLDWRPYLVDEWPLARTLATGETIIHEEVELFHGKGKTSAVYVSSSAVPDDTGTIRYGIVLVSDITEQKRAEEELHKIAMALQQSNNELERFAYIASHDLREPLRMVTSFSQLLAQKYQGKLDNDADEFIGYIVDGAARMDALVNDLLEYSRVGSQAKPFGQVNLNVVLAEALQNLSVQVEESNADIRWEVLPVVSADHSQMIQVFQNLISNALKFRGTEDPRIRIGGRRDGDEWRISVKDNGIGIDPEYSDKVFEIFQRLHTQKTYPGTGIGLAVCRKIVERHGGRIWVESSEGNGSTFFFTIPAAPGTGDQARYARTG
ncbi:PAS domain S-box-containing protein [Methanolinea mesophila]|uniref:sensor histidine kinase n=1 Tax=Methanolinea mesophila TaxID=547055 RepID=UPI001AE13C28|nr:ATP-binding protein [Methanolinea mesophila]MBP1927697.1 PAS domain S-box-containing protein [Methanolinea mesophila]